MGPHNSDHNSDNNSDHQMYFFNEKLDCGPKFDLLNKKPRNELFGLKMIFVKL